MRRRASVLGALGLGLGLGMLIGCYFSPGPYRYFYRTSKPLFLAGPGEGVGAQIPSGSPLLSDTKLVRAPDLGWQACVPVSFHTMWAAQDQGVIEAESLSYPTLAVRVDFSAPGEVAPP